MNLVRTGPPDLLRRFVPTPYKLIHGTTTFETNDLELLDAIDCQAIPEEARHFAIRIVRDTCADALHERRVFESDRLCLISIGSYTLFIVDSEEQRVFAFLASDFPAARICEELRSALDARR
ncbi:MAG TPA: hypothetical protein VGL89_19390 [Candidatus Koribacter sp.]|jgi:hypothetical protein